MSNSPAPSSPLPVVSAEIVAALAAYVPELLNAAQTLSGLADLRELVARCEPVSVVDALVMMSSASRFLADVAPPDVLDIYRWIIEAEVTAWAHVQHRGPMPSATLSNHLQRLRRMLRVRRGLPARMNVHNVAAPRRAPMSPTDRSTLEQQLTVLGGPVAAAYVTGVGAGAVGAVAEQAMIIVTCGVAEVVMRDGTVLHVVAALQSMACALAGVVVEECSWSEVRGQATRLGVQVDKEIAVTTHAVLALSEAADLVSISRRHRITRRLIDRAVPCLALPDTAAIRAMLRG